MCIMQAMRRQSANVIKGFEARLRALKRSLKGKDHQYNILRGHVGGKA